MAAQVRSYLYTPGNAEPMLRSASGRGADAVIADLEDSVSSSERSGARGVVGHWLRSTGETVVERWVRINSDAWEEDLEAILGTGLTGIVLPKAELSLIEAVVEVLRGWELGAEVAPQTVRLMPLVESARALRDIDLIASVPGVDHLGMGEADLAADLMLLPSDSESELLYARSRVVAASRAAGIGPPTASTSTDYADLDRLALSTAGLRRLGFRSRTAIHPAQLSVINRVFSPDDAEVASAQAIIDAIEAASRQGSGVTQIGDGTMVDRAVGRAAAQVLEASAESEGMDPPSTD